MVIEQDENDREWVHTYRRVDGKNVFVRIPLEQYEREKEAIRVAKEKQIAEEEAEKERQAAEAERQRRAAKLATLTPFDAMLIAARRGCKEILPKLRQFLDEHSELVIHYGSLTMQVQENWLQLIAGKDLLLSETMRRHLNAMRKELAGANPSPLDRLLVDRIIATHIELLYFTAMEATDPTAENMRVARYRMDRGAQAHRQFLSAVKMLATVRNLVARTNVIQIELLHPPMVQAPVTPIMPSTNGTKKASRAEPAPSFNGVNRLNGRLAGVLEPMGISKG